MKTLFFVALNLTLYLVSNWFARRAGYWKAKADIIQHIRLDMVELRGSPDFSEKLLASTLNWLCEIKPKEKVHK